MVNQEMSRFDQLTYLWIRKNLGCKFNPEQSGFEPAPTHSKDFNRSNPKWRANIRMKFIVA